MEGTRSRGNTAGLDRALREKHKTSEILISWVQIGLVGLFASVYFLSPKAFDQASFEPVPAVLSIYAPFLGVRLWLALKRRLSQKMLVGSAVVDVGAVLALIYAFHLQYHQPLAFALKAPTFTALYIVVALRALCFRALYLVVAGCAAIIGWLALTGLAWWDAPHLITHSFVDYANADGLLLGAEVEKSLSLAAVTAVLVFAVVRSRKLLFRSVHQARLTQSLARFLSPDIVEKIAESADGLQPGKGEKRHAAILLMDLRGFSELSVRLPADQVMNLLNEYQDRMLRCILAHGGCVDKFMGDGILAHFGAATETTTYAADCLRAAQALVREAAAWNEERTRAGLPALGVGVACAVGDVVFGAVGNEERMELTAIGDAVNLTAKLEKHSKKVDAAALTTETMFYLACRQGYCLDESAPRKKGEVVEGIPHTVNLVILERLGTNLAATRKDGAA